METKDRTLIYPKIFLLIGVISFAFGAILIRYSDAPALAIAFYRLLFATVIMGLFGLNKAGSFLKIDSRSFFILILNGLVLATHFALWIISLKFTTVAKIVSLIFTGKLKKKYVMDVDLDAGKVLDKGKYAIVKNGDVIVVDAKTVPKLLRSVREKYIPFVPEGY